MRINHKTVHKVLLLFLTLSLMLASACSPDPTGTTRITTQTGGTSAPTVTTAPQRQDIPLVIGYTPFAANFNPFFAQTGSDRDVVLLTSLSLLTLDRSGSAVEQAIQGETRPYADSLYPYQGIADVATDYDESADTTTFAFTLRDDLVFSDGESLTADDVIFSLYVLLDPSYPLQTSLHDLPIVGITDYRRQISQALYDRYDAQSLAIYAAGEDHAWSEQDGWSEAQQNSFWQQIKAAWVAEIEAIIAHVYDLYLVYADQYTGYQPAEIDNDGRKTMLAMAIWNFAYVADDGYLVGAYSEKAWDLPDDVYPSPEDFYHETWLAYTGNPEAFWGIEGVEKPSVLEAAKTAYIYEWAPKDEAMGDAGVPSISGIRKTGERTVAVTIAGHDPTAVNKLNITVAPLHYYGDRTLYDYETASFGFSFGDLSEVEAKSAEPLGGGPYRFVRYQDNTVYLAANELYYRGEPEISNLQLKENAAADLIAAVNSGIIDMAATSLSDSAVAEIRRYNQSDELSGSRIVTRIQAEPAYGYIGLNAATVNVAGVPSSQASRYLRQGLATVFTAGRSVAETDLDELLPLNNPFADRMWPASDDVSTPFSVGIEGNRLYHAAMTGEEKTATAAAAAVSFLEAAGYTADASGTRLTEAPDGAALDYTLLLTADAANHPLARESLDKAIAALADIGISIDLEVLDDPSQFAARLQSGEVSLWCALRQMAAQPDLFSVYHSDKISGDIDGAQGNVYHLADTKLDDLITEAGRSADPAEREQLYQASLTILLDWAVEIPLFLQQTVTVTSAQRVEPGSVATDPTTYWNWRHDVDKLRLRPAG